MARSFLPQRVALVVHPDVATLSAYQLAFSQAGFTPIIARELPMALLAVTQHPIEVAVISSKIAEEGDGWPLAGVVRQAFAPAFVAVIARETSVHTLQAAINNGLNEIYESSVTPNVVVDSILSKLRLSAPYSPKPPRSVHPVQ